MSPDVLWYYNGYRAVPANIRAKYIPANPVTLDWLVHLVSNSRSSAFYFVAPLPDDAPVDVLHMDWFN